MPLTSGRPGLGPGDRPRQTPGPRGLLPQTPLPQAPHRSEDTSRPPGSPRVSGTPQPQRLVPKHTGGYLLGAPGRSAPRWPFRPAAPQNERPPCCCVTKEPPWGRPPVRTGVVLTCCVSRDRVRCVARGVAGERVISLVPCTVPKLQGRFHSGSASANLVLARTCFKWPDCGHPFRDERQSGGFCGVRESACPLHAGAKRRTGEQP